MPTIIGMVTNQTANKPLQQDKEVPITFSKYYAPQNPQIEKPIARGIVKKNRVLMVTQSVFPFDFFPDKLIIDENKLSIYNRDFFFNDDVRCFCYKDIQFVEIFSSLIFASLCIKVFGFPNDEIKIRYLKRNEAFRARRLIQGLIEGTKANVDFSDMNTSELIYQAEILGSAHGGNGYELPIGGKLL